MWPKRLSARQAQGREHEQLALNWLKRQHLTLVEENFRCPLGEIDLIMRDGATLVFVEVRQRSTSDHGNASATITPTKQGRLIRAARTYLMRFEQLPVCRFDVVAIDGEQLEWLCNVIEM